jgi:diadenosine tetraphosphate (Ap4A) HIT family hydrolase
LDQLNNSAYRDQWHALNRHLGRVRSESGLGAALHRLMLHQIESGFIQDELAQIIRYRFPCPFEPTRTFSAQFNPARARRFQGAGRSDPTVPRIHDGCFLCVDNIQWQHQGAEVGFDLPDAGSRYTAWMNPFPLLPCHTIIAGRQHLPQHWRDPGARSLGELVTDLAGLSAQLPGWIGFYNGVGAGASIPHHLHFHFLPRPAGYQEMPLEQAAREFPDNDRVEAIYPLSFMHWSGTMPRVLEQSLAWLEQWRHGSGAPEDASANIIACTRYDSSAMDIYFIPRHQRRSRAEGLAGVVGGFEAMGEIVCSTSEEKQRLDSGQVDYPAIAAMLRQVSVAI